MTPRFIQRLGLPLILATVFVIGACSSPQSPKFPELRYTHLPTILLDVSKIEIVDNFTPDGNEHVEDRMPVPPEAALRNWAKDRLKATGVSGTAKFIIENASVTQTKLKGKGGLSGAMTTEQSHRYNADVRVLLRIEGVPRVKEAYAQAAVKRTQTIAEDASINVREQLWFDFTEAVMRDFDPLMSESIRKHLGNIVR